MKVNTTGLSRGIFLAALLISPLIFFTNLTRNPYLIQERVLQVMFALSVFLLAVGLAGKREVRLPATFLDLPLLLFFGFCLLSLPVSIIRFPGYSSAIKGYSGRALLMFFFSGVLPFYFAAASDERMGKKIRAVVIAAATLASAYAVLQFLNLDFIWPEGIDPYGQRSISTLGNPNFLSSFLMVAVYWIIYRAAGEKKILGWVLLLTVNLAGLSIAMTRSAFLGLFSGIGFLVIYALIKKEALPRKVRSYILVSAAAAVLTGGVFAVSSRQFSQRVVSMFSTRQMGAALTQRQLIWESSLKMFRDTPLAGRGWGNFEIFYPFYQGRLVERPQYRDLRTHANNAHNFFLEILAQTGIAGTGLYLLFMIVFLKYAAALCRHATGGARTGALLLTVAAFSFWVDNLLNVSLFFPIPALVFWLNLGFLAGQGRRLASSPERVIRTGRLSRLLPAAAGALLIWVTLYNYRYFRSAVHYFSGFGYSRQGRLFDAEEELQKSRSYYPIVDSLYELGNVYARMSYDDPAYRRRAVSAYTEAIGANPGYDEIYFNRAVMLLQEEEPEEALRDLEKAFSINPVSPDILRMKGDTLGSLGKHGEAARLYARLLEFERSAGYLINYARHLELAGRVSEAAAAYISALEIYPEEAAAVSGALRTAAALREDREEEISGFLDSAADLQREGKTEEALSRVSDALELIPSDPELLLKAADLNLELGMKEEARRLYLAVTRLAPGNRRAEAGVKQLE